MEKFTDYYRLLEVHYDASPEVIRAAYHKLSQVYHPDGNMGGDKMALLNVAYDTLSDEKKRLEYHEKWLANYGRAATGYSGEFVPKAEGSAANAVAAMDDFFYSLLNGYYERAYVRLSEDDKKDVSLTDFMDFRKAVDACYEMRSYALKLNKMIADPIIGSMHYKRAAEIVVTVKEFDLTKNLDNSESVVKTAVYDGTSWRIVLGMHQIKNATARFRLMAERLGSYDPVMFFRENAKKIDLFTGLLSEYGLNEELEKEFYRCKRYVRPLSLIAVRCPESDMIKLAGAIKTVLRRSDFAGVTNDKQIVIVMPETDPYKAILAEKKIGKIIDETGISKTSCYIKRQDARLFESPKEALRNI